MWSQMIMKYTLRHIRCIITGKRSGGMGKNTEKEVEERGRRRWLSTWHFSRRNVRSQSILSGLLRENSTSQTVVGRKFKHRRLQFREAVHVWDTPALSPGPVVGRGHSYDGESIT